LTEDELGDLSDVLEDMDQISERLEELQIQIQELEGLEKQYDNYNKVLLYHVSLDLKVLNHSFNERKKELDDCKKNLDNTISCGIALKTQILKAELEIEKIQSELDYLQQSEGLEKPIELERLHTDYKKLNERYVAVKKRMADNERRVEAWQNEIAEKKVLRDELFQNQDSLLEELESYARVMEFYEHDIYHRQWQQVGDDYARCADNWNQDLLAHQVKLKAAVLIGEREREASLDMAKEKARWGEFYKKKSLAEEEYLSAEEKFSAGKMQLKECIIGWRQGLSQLEVSNENVGYILTALSELGKDNRNYETVRSSVYNLFLGQYQQLTNKVLVLEQQFREFEEKRELLQAELDSWRSHKEPEPLRSLSRNKCRGERAERMGAPLYTVCDFSAELTEAEKAQLETTLEQAGILDAWILPGGRMGYFAHEKDEEIWIEPCENPGVVTLSDVLAPCPSDESGLTKEDIALVLSSFTWSGEMDYMQDSMTSAAFNQIGREGFRLGALAGRNSTKEQAEYIGSENRQKAKRRVIDQLEQQVLELENKQDAIQEKIYQEHEKQDILTAEKESFPDDGEIQLCLDHLTSKWHLFQAAIKQEKEAEIIYHKKEADWKERKVELTEITSAWTRLKTLSTLSEAMNCANDYKTSLSQLKTEYVHYRSLQNDCENYQRYIDEANEQISDNQLELSGVRKSQVLLESQISQLEERAKRYI